MSDKCPNSRRNLDLAIERMFGHSANIIQIKVIMANAIIGQLLPSGVVKGGSAMKLRYGDATTRFTSDLDTARGINLTKYLDELERALKIGWNGFTGRLVIKSPANPQNVPADYIMQPYDVKLEYNGKSWITVRIEIGHDEIGDTDHPDYLISKDIREIFLKLNFPEPKPIALLPIHHQIAQKLHALSSLNSERAHDLIDLQLIIQHEPVDLPLVHTACNRLFESRRQQSWPPVIIKGYTWDKLYSSQIGRLPVAQNVDEAIDVINKFILKICKPQKSNSP